MTDQTTAIPAWQDGDPTMEAIAAAVYEHCEVARGTGLVIDDPRNIAAAAVAGIRDAARQTAGQPAADAPRCALPEFLGCDCNHLTGCQHPVPVVPESALCGGPVPCEDGGAPCDKHEREQAHAEGEHAFCGNECPTACTCASAGDAFVPAGHYRDCPQATTVHACSNCDGVDPDTCLTNPDRPAAGLAAPTNHGTETELATATEPARQRIINHPGVLATADTEIAALLDEHRAEILNHAADEVQALIQEWPGMNDVAIRLNDSRRAIAARLRRLAAGAES